MKKILALSLVLSVMACTSAFAATTYTESFIQKHTQKAVNAEKQLQEKQKANQAALEKRQKERQQAIEKQKKANQAALEKRQKERQAAIEKQKKANQAKRAETQKKIEKKKQLWNQLIND